MSHRPASRHPPGTALKIATRLPDRGIDPVAITAGYLLQAGDAQRGHGYWAAWSDVPVPWTRADVGKVPDHWRRFAGRASPLTGNPRLAGNPPNAMLNYLYAILEGEARLACLGTGLDPGLGVLHADQKSRDSMALDVMEAVRPAVDSYVLNLPRDGVFRADDFYETRLGVCRVLPPLTHRLAETAPLWARHLAPVVEHVANALFASSASRMPKLPTLLTQANRSAGRDGLRRGPSTHPKTPTPKARIWRGCGTVVAADQRWCAACRPAVKLETGSQALARARKLRAQLHAHGLDPSASDEAKAKNRDARSRRLEEEKAWDAEHPPRPGQDVFRTEILPMIADVPIRQLAKATGLSVGYCGYVRKGVYVPHPRWWDILRQVSNTIAEPGPASHLHRVDR